MSALIAEIRQGNLDPQTPAIFIHSGGQPQTLAFSSDFGTRNRLDPQFPSQRGLKDHTDARAARFFDRLTVCSTWIITKYFHIRSQSNYVRTFN